MAGTIHHSHQPLALSHDDELHPPDAKTIARRQVRLFDPPAVDERAVGTRQIQDFEIVVGRGQPAVEARDKGGMDDEVGARRAADGFDGAGSQAKRRVGLGILQDPH